MTLAHGIEPKYCMYAVYKEQEFPMIVYGFSQGVDL